MNMGDFGPVHIAYHNWSCVRLMETALIFVTRYMVVRTQEIQTSATVTGPDK